MSWTDERVELLSKLWLDGRSASQIAAELGLGVTRNAVIGKVHRLGLAGRPKATAPVVPTPNRAKAKPAPRSREEDLPEIAPFEPVAIDATAAGPEVQPPALVSTQDEVMAIPFSERVTIMDLRLPVMTGVEAITEIRRNFPLARIIVLTTYDGDEDIYRALQAGARGYLLKDMSGDDLMDAIRTVHAGRSRIPPAVAQRLADRLGGPDLTTRELEV